MRRAGKDGFDEVAVRRFVFEEAQDDLFARLGYSQVVDEIDLELNDLRLQSLDGIEWEVRFADDASKGHGIR